MGNPSEVDAFFIHNGTYLTRATGNSRFETKIPLRSAKNSRKFPLSINPTVCNTSTLYTACIPYADFMGREVGFF